MSAAAKDARGEPDTDKSEAELIEFFKVMDSITADAEGVSMTNMMATHR